jgi:hypothetical protein
LDYIFDLCRADDFHGGDIVGQNCGGSCPIGSRVMPEIEAQSHSTKVESYTESDRDEFLMAYEEAALWTSSDNSDESGGEPFDENYGPEDFAEETQKAMLADCVAFLDAAHTFINAETCLGNSRMPMRQAGMDFWLTRCGHGVGFWEDDRWTVEAGKTLTELADKAGNVDLYLGDDGLIYQS